MPDESELIRLLHEDYATRAQTGVVNGMDADKDKAAESTAIEKNTGQDAQVIYGNFDEYTQRRKSSLAQGLIERDNHLIQYVNSHPMAANVSKDDWGALSEVSETIKRHPELGAGLGPFPSLVVRALPDILDNIKSGIDQMKAAPVEIDPAAALARTQKLVEEGREASKSLTKGPLWTPEFQKKVDEALAKSAQSPQLLNLLYGAMQMAGSPLIGIFQSEVSKPIEEKTGWPAELTEGAALWVGALFGLRAEHVAVRDRALNAKLDRIRDTVDRVDPYLRSGETPPIGADLATDILIGMDSQQKMEILDAIMKADGKTETRELSPELYNNLTKLQHGDQNIYVRANAVKALYGDKLPTPDDGMLGWAPRIEEQLRDSARTGEDIEIPLADWRARVDPEISKLLHDDLLFQDGMTAREAKALPKPDEAVAATIDEAAIPGLIQELDRPFKLSKTGPGQFGITGDTQAPTTISKTSLIPDPSVAIDMGKVADQVVTQVGDALAQGAKVIYYIDGKPIEIVKIDRGMMADAQGQRWGIMQLLSPTPGARTQIEIAPTKPTKVGQVRVAETDNGKTLVVHWEEGADNIAGLRSLLMQLKEQYPNAENITGPKTPGMQALEKALQGSKVRADIPFRVVEHPIDTARRAAGMDPLGLEEPLVQPLEAGGPIFEPGVLLPKRMYTKLMRAMDEVRDTAARKMFGDAEKEERQRQTPEWRANAAKVREEVLTQIASRPDFRTSAFFRNGRFMGQDTHYLPKLDPKFLTPEQRRGLPSRFLAKDGLDPNDIAGSFGYSTGADMVNKMVEFEKAKGDLGPTEFLRKMIDEETNRRMEQQYGKLSENIAKAAREHLLNKEQFDVLHEEYIRLGELAGQQLPLSQADIKTAAGLDFSNQISSKVSVIKYARELGRSGRATHDAYLKGDYIGAFKARQEQLHIMAKAQLAKEFEKRQERLEASIERHRKPVVGGEANPYTEMIHQIMFQVKRPPQRSIQNLAENIAKRDEKTLEEFANARNNIGLPEGVLEYEVDYNQNIPVAEFLKDQAWSKDLDATTVSEFKDIDNTIRALSKMGRDEFSFIRQGEASDLAKLKSTMISKLEEIGVKKQYKPGEEPSFWRTANASLIQMEFLFNRMGSGDPIFLKHFGFEFARAEGGFTKDIRATSAKMIEIEKKYRPKIRPDKDKIPNDVFYNPQGLKNGQIPAGGTEWLPMTRANLRAVALNAGNPSNLKWMAQGWNTTPERIMQWLDKHATKEDWHWAREIGDIFKDIQADADRMTKEMNDTIIEKLPVGKIQTKAAGELDGWYYPIVYDRTRQGGPKPQIKPTPMVKPTTDSKWQIRRTSPQGPIDLSIQPLANQISRRLRDNNFRQVVHESSKILLDKEFQGAVSRHLGPHYAKLFEPYLRDVAGMNGYTSAAEKGMERTLEHLRQNVISTMIGYKIGTVLKHGPTAFFQSWQEAGIFAPDFYKSAASLYGTNSITGNTNMNFMMKGGKVGSLDWGGSTELQRRSRHWRETIGGATDAQLGEMNFREKMMYWASKPVAFSDMISSTILWNAKYDRIMKEGLTKGLSIEEAHTSAVDMADYAVRRTHGSTAITSRPELMRRQSVLWRSLASLYGFFNHIYNRYYEMAWKAKDVGPTFLRGEPDWKGARDLTSDAMFYVLVPAMIEEVVANWWLQSEKEDEEYTPWTFFRNGIFHTVAGAVPGARDAAHAIQTGHDPAVGIFGEPAKALTNLARDINPNREDFKPGNIVHHAIVLLGIVKGIAPDQVGRWAKFLTNVIAGEVDPSTMTSEEWYRAIRTGDPEQPKHR